MTASADAPTTASGCWRIDVYGRSSAATTPLAERADPALTAAMTVLAANKQARLAGALATVGRIDTEPGDTGAVAQRVTLWLDLRAAGDDALAGLVAGVVRQARDRAERDGTRVEVTPVGAGGQ